ncbi:cupin domain-containing protein [Phenylobacterium sp.]|jgi:uncharacterized cupin superfamily protein|uniref:cupin domain-containing protein n=1 Tax=Phenylobacterium sp. TaxID=1871053 RepID=UPI0037839D6E
MRALALALLLAAAPAAAVAEAPLKILRFQPDGPHPGAMKTYGYGASKIYIYDGAMNGPSAGAWSSPDLSSPMARWNFASYIKVLEGEVTFRPKSGPDMTFRPGESIFFPRGTEFSWFRTRDLKEYFVVFDFAPPGAPAPVADPQVVRLDPAGPPRDIYKGPNGAAMRLWTTPPVTTPAAHVAANPELLVFLEGHVTLRTASGQVERFGPGDVALTPRGLAYTWTSDAARLYRVVLDNPAPR